MKSRSTDSDVVAGRWVLALAAIAALAAGIYFWTRRAQEQEAPPQPVATSPPAADAPAPAVEHPVEITTAEPLPPLDESDAEAAAGLAAMFPEGRFERLFVGKDLIRRITVTIDNLPRRKVAMRLRPLEPMPDRFVATGPEQSPVLDESNFARYRPYVDIVDAIDADQAIAAYRRLYPLFQEAYEELGNPSGYFNDRVIEVIDHLLATPKVPAPIPLARPNVLFEFADQELESRSAGQKFLIRIGPDNAARVKAKLRELRGGLT